MSGRAPAGPGAVARLGHALRRGRRVIAALQWAMVACYAVLATLPAFMPSNCSSLELAHRARPE